MNIIYFLLIGLLAGWLAGKVVQGRGFGLPGNLVVGVLGALLGGFLFRLIGVTAYGTIGEILLAFVGALVLLFLMGFIKKS
jgi:uncharacterized membrane protein YeaQ/YmgE (transglycosylase-associated protein family)